MGYFGNNVSTNEYFYGKDDRKECKGCKKEISILDDQKYKGHCWDCWHHLGVKPKKN